MWDRSRERWRNAAPDAELTWGRELDGDAFITAVATYGTFSEDRSILEIGPGYGRLLRGALAAELPFSRYVGVDLSEKNVRTLTERFSADERIRFINADIESATLDTPVDNVISSLTLKHLYPSWERAVANIVRSVNPGGRFIFDLIERSGVDRLVGTDRYVETADDTYIRHYSREEVSEMLERSGLEREAFDEVVHAPDFSRLLVVARKPG